MKSKITKSILDIVAVLLVFGLGQAIGGIVGGILGSMFGASYGGGYMSWTISIALFTASVFTILLLFGFRYLVIRSHWLEKTDFIAIINPSRLRWHLAPLMLIATFAGAVSTGCLAQVWGVEDRLEETIQNLATNPIGILTIVFMGPLSEELVFRHAILGGMLRRGVSPWIAILVSSLLFGIIHWNPIQVLFASALGVMLGILYAKSQSIVPSLIYHIINNGFAVVVMILSKMVEGQQDATPDVFDNPILAYSMAAIGALVCIPAYIYYWHKPTLNSQL
ncbi:MAG: CPBP family intramembrane metalloprotease [Bacteroidaceae bacterium]|nr:CPBP family intramembrane metalloprotease [Bacteroidaceae bacterium]